VPVEIEMSNARLVEQVRQADGHLVLHLVIGKEHLVRMVHQLGNFLALRMRRGPGAKAPRCAQSPRRALADLAVADQFLVDQRLRSQLVVLKYTGDATDFGLLHADLLDQYATAFGQLVGDWSDVFGHLC
jgi:hypothetical protein